MTYGYGLYFGRRPLYIGVMLNGLIIAWQRGLGLRVWTNAWRKAREPIRDWQRTR